LGTLYRPAKNLGINKKKNGRLVGIVLLVKKEMGAVCGGGNLKINTRGRLVEKLRVLGLGGNQQKALPAGLPGFRTILWPNFVFFPVKTKNSVQKKTGYRGGGGGGGGGGGKKKKKRNHKNKKNKKQKKKKGGGDLRGEKKKKKKRGVGGGGKKGFCALGFRKKREQKRGGGFLRVSRRRD